MQLISLLKTKPTKTIRHLAEVIESTERTVYRYLDLLEEVGFHIGRDAHHRVFIESGEEVPGLSFTAEECNLLRQLLETAAKKSKFKDGILKKLAIHSESHLSANHLLKAHLGKIIEQLSLAIQQQRQVIIRKYQSINSDTISDRLVEPICFTDNFESLAAYEVKTGKNKYFNVERISTVEVRKQPFAHLAAHKFSKPDVFGFSENGNKHRIDLLMSLRVAVLLREEYPMTAPFIKPVVKSGKYRFSATVNDFKPISRFVLGFPEDITVVESQEFKAHLKSRVEKLLARKI